MAKKINKKNIGNQEIFLIINKNKVGKVRNLFLAGRPQGSPWYCEDR